MNRNGIPKFTKIKNKFIILRFIGQHRATDRSIEIMFKWIFPELKLFTICSILKLRILQLGI